MANRTSDTHSSRLPIDFIVSPFARFANLEAAGLRVAESGALGFRDLQFAQATAPGQT